MALHLKCLKTNRGSLLASECGVVCIIDLSGLTSHHALTLSKPLNEVLTREVSFSLITPGSQQICQLVLILHSFYRQNDVLTNKIEVYSACIINDSRALVAQFN